MLNHILGNINLCKYCIVNKLKRILNTSAECKEYTKFGCNNAITGKETMSDKSSPIIGGRYAYDGQFPHMVFIVNYAYLQITNTLISIFFITY